MSFFVFQFFHGAACGADKEELIQSVATKAPVISEVGKELTALLTELAEGEIDAERRLPLEPVIKRASVAVEKFPQYLLVQEGRLIAEAQRREAFAALLPQVSVSAGSGQRDGSLNGIAYSGIGDQRSLTAKQLLYDFGATTGTLRASEKRLAATDHKLEGQKSEVLLKALDTFYETQRALMQVRLSRENLQARRSFVKYIRDREELGASSKADVVRAEARVAEALEQVATSMQRLSNAQASYRQFYGLEAEPYVFPKDPATPGFDVLRVSDFLSDHPQLREAEMNLQAAREDLDASKARLFGGVYLEASKSETLDPGRPMLRNDSIMVVLRSDIYSGGGQVARVAQAEAKLSQSRMEVDRLRLELERQLREAYAEYSGQIAAVSARLLVFRASEESYAIAKDLYAFSRSSLFEVFKAQEELYLVGQRLIDSMVDRAKSKFKLLHASQQLTKFVYGPMCPGYSECTTESLLRN